MRRFLAVFVVIAAVLVVGGCTDDDGSDDAGGASDATEVGNGDGGETAAADGPPCYGLAQAESLPDWADGLAFGEKHEYPGGFTDLTDAVGCEVAAGVVIVSEDGRMTQAYVEDCDDFESRDVPQELRPDADEPWICNADAGEGAISVEQRKG